MKKTVEEKIELERKTIAAMADTLGGMIMVHYHRLDRGEGLTESQEETIRTSEAAEGIAKMIKQMTETACGTLSMIVKDADDGERVVGHRFGYDPNPENYSMLISHSAMLAHHFLLNDLWYVEDKEGCECESCGCCEDDEDEPVTPFFDTKKVDA